MSLPCISQTTDVHGERRVRPWSAKTRHSSKESINLIIKLIPLWLVLQMFFFSSNSIDVGFRPDRVVFIIIIIIFIIQIIKKEIQLVPISRIEILMIIFTLICTISLIKNGANLDENQAHNRWLNALFNITYFPFITFYIAKNVKFNSQSINSIFLSMCFIGMYLSLTGMFEHFRVNALVWPKQILDANKGIQFERVRGPFLESVAMGRVLSMTFLAFLLMATQYNSFKKGIMYFFSLLTTLSIYYTYTRGPWIGFGMILLALLIFDNQMKKLVSMLLVFIFIVAMLGIGSKFSLFEGTLFTQRQETVNDRIVSYSTALRMAGENPLWGVGFGKFEYEWDNYSLEIEGGFANPEKVSHNTFLGLFAETGGIGLLLYLSILYQMIKMCYKTYKSIDKTRYLEKNIAVIAMAVSAMYILSGYVSDVRWSLMQNNLVFLFFGISASIAEQLRLRGQNGSSSFKRGHEQPSTTWLLGAPTKRWHG
jgi:O-antigen ligase